MLRTLALLLALTGCSPVDLLNATVPKSAASIERNIAYGEGPRRTLDIYHPTGTQPSPLIVFIYGGSWRTGSKADYAFAAEPLAARGAVVVVPDYRLYPETTFPGFLDDCAAATAWAVAHAAALGADPKRVFLIGHSAGAYNVAMLALDPALLAAAGTSRAALAGAVGIATPASFLPSADPDVIPVFGPANTPAHQPLAYADGSNPPLLLLHGDADTTVEPRNTAELAAAIRAHGGPVETRLYPGIAHIGIITALTPLFRSRAPVLDDIMTFIAGGGRS